tara:strand:- start:3212 stop:3415 length:204 start_codon:yes stop_codon:yes gene_type:complete
MKKVLLFVVIVGGLVFTSCSKKTDCECTVDGTTTSTSLDEANKDATIELTQDQFETICKLGTGCELK